MAMLLFNDPLIGSKILSFVNNAACVYRIVFLSSKRMASKHSLYKGLSIKCRDDARFMQATINNLDIENLRIDVQSRSPNQAIDMILALRNRLTNMKQLCIAHYSFHQTFDASMECNKRIPKSTLDVSLLPNLRMLNVMTIINTRQVSKNIPQRSILVNDISYNIQQNNNENDTSIPKRLGKKRTIQKAIIDLNWSHVDCIVNTAMENNLVTCEAVGDATLTLFYPQSCAYQPRLLDTVKEINSLSLCKTITLTVCPYLFHNMANQSHFPSAMSSLANAREMNFIFHVCNNLAAGNILPLKLLVSCLPKKLNRLGFASSHHQTHKFVDGMNKPIVDFNYKNHCTFLSDLPASLKRINGLELILTVVQKQSIFGYPPLLKTENGTTSDNEKSDFLSLLPSLDIDSFGQWSFPWFPKLLFSKHFNYTKISRLSLTIDDISHLMMNIHRKYHLSNVDTLYMNVSNMVYIGDTSKSLHKRQKSHFKDFFIPSNLFSILPRLKSIIFFSDFASQINPKIESQWGGLGWNDMLLIKRIDILRTNIKLIRGIIGSHTHSKNDKKLQTMPSNALLEMARKMYQNLDTLFDAECFEHFCLVKGVHSFNPLHDIFNVPASSASKFYAFIN